MVSSGVKTTREQLNVLLVDPEPRRALRVTAVLRSDDATPVVDGRLIRRAAGLRDLDALDPSSFDLVVASLWLSDGCGLEVLPYLQRRETEVPVIIVGEADDAVHAVEAISAGALDFVVTSGPHLELLPLAVEKAMALSRIRRRNERMRGELGRSLAELEQRTGQLESLISRLETKARTDPLTGLGNRRWLNLMLQGAWAEASRYDLPLACMMIDLDGFKMINDVRGHQHGDELLRTAARVITANCRELDITGRYGGDEFCVVMPHTEPYEAFAAAERLREEFCRVTDGYGDDVPRPAMSIGLAHRHLSEPTNAAQLVAHADEALYAAKDAGRDRVMLREMNGVTVPMRS